MKSKEIATRIKELRLQNGFSQEELAEKSGLSLRTVQRIEGGGTEPSEDSLKRLAKVLGETKETFSWTMKENRGLLMMTNFSALSILFYSLFFTSYFHLLFGSQIEEQLKTLIKPQKEF